MGKRGRDVISMSVEKSAQFEWVLYGRHPDPNSKISSRIQARLKLLEEWEQEATMEKVILNGSHWLVGCRFH
jgi:hypothetical protein